MSIPFMVCMVSNGNSGIAYRPTTNSLVISGTAVPAACNFNSTVFSTTNVTNTTPAYAYDIQTPATLIDNPTNGTTKTKATLVAINPGGTVTVSKACAIEYPFSGSLTSGTLSIYGVSITNDMIGLNFSEAISNAAIIYSIDGGSNWIALGVDSGGYLPQNINGLLSVHLTGISSLIVRICCESQRSYLSSMDNTFATASIDTYDIVFISD